MTSDHDPTPATGSTAPIPAPVAALLADPQLWTVPSPGVEAELLATIAAGSPSSAAGRPDPDPAPTAGAARAARPARRRRVGPLRVAATLLVAAAGGYGALRSVGPAPAAELELAGTGGHSAAGGQATIEELSNGVRIVLETRDLAPAPDGTFYAVWLVRDDPPARVSAGSFHNRGAAEPIELWSGVAPDRYPKLTVTLQQEADPDGLGPVVLEGRLGP
jgi:hypothetical protein